MWSPDSDGGWMWSTSLVMSPHTNLFFCQVEVNVAFRTAQWCGCILTTREIQVVPFSWLMVSATAWQHNSWTNMTNLQSVWRSIGWRAPNGEVQHWCLSTHWYPLVDWCVGKDRGSKKSTVSLVSLLAHVFVSFYILTYPYGCFSMILRISNHIVSGGPYVPEWFVTYASVLGASWNPLHFLLLNSSNTQDAKRFVRDSRATFDFVDILCLCHCLYRYYREAGTSDINIQYMELRTVNIYIHIYICIILILYYRSI